jgi:hypothetical protein
MQFCRHSVGLILFVGYCEMICFLGRLVFLLSRGCGQYVVRNDEIQIEYHMIFNSLGYMLQYILN